jgi:putative cardiolipin synthase
MTPNYAPLLYRQTVWGPSKRPSPQSIIVSVIILITVILSGCLSVPRTLPKDTSPKAVSYTYEPPPDNRLALLSNQLLADTPEDASGFFMLERNDDALKWRLLLTDLAEETLDMQYYVRKGDASAHLLLDRVIKAADRGVRVRLLLDDVLHMGADPAVAALSRHPQIEVRLFNPLENRNESTFIRAMEYAGKIKQLNRRMHNKLFMADSRLAITGGRNIGNEYFGLNPKQNFVDLDVLTLGEVIPQMAWTFDLFWNSEWAYPGEALIENHPAPNLLDELRHDLQQSIEDNQDLLTALQSDAADTDQMLEALKANLYTGTADVVYDEPLVDTDMPPVQLIESLRQLKEKAHSEILIASPYFIPDNDFYQTMPDITAAGVRLVVLTNSLGATNHPIVHSGYKKHRARVLDTGAQLFEFRRDASPAASPDTPPVKSKAVGLHAKFIAIDRHIVFVGSLNLDPRSLYTNTEVGLLIESADFAETATILFEDLAAPKNSWQVCKNEKNRLVWQSGSEVRKSPPPSSFGRRFQSWFFGLFSLDEQL